jgi:hypothetical protein
MLSAIMCADRTVAPCISPEACLTVIPEAMVDSGDVLWSWVSI